MRWLDTLIDKRAAALIDERVARAIQHPEPSRVRVRGLAGTAADEQLSPEKYLEYARISNAVYACSTLRANMLSALPLRAYKIGTPPATAGRVRYGRTIDISSPVSRLGMPQSAHGRAVAGEVTEVEAGPLVDLLSKVNTNWTRRRLVYMTEMSLCLAGQGFWTLERGTNGKRPPSAIYYVKHTRMAAQPDAKTIIAGWVQDANTKEEQKLTPGEVVWYRFPDPLDPDYGALPPLAAARLGADVYRAAMKSNWALFANGYAPGGFVFPPEGQQWDDEQLGEAQEAVRQKMEGVERRHRWLFMPEHYDIQPNTMTPKDAEFLGGLDFAVEDVARAYGLPIELVGGARRTYQNLENALSGVWMFTLEPEASFIADEMTEQLVPMFEGEADFVAFDLSGVTALQDDETAEWARAKEQLDSRVITINEWRAGQGLDPAAWGDVAWTPAGLKPITDVSEGVPGDIGADFAGGNESGRVGKINAVLAGLKALAEGKITPEALTALFVDVIGVSPETARVLIEGGGKPPALEKVEADVAKDTEAAGSDETVADPARSGNGRAAGSGVEGRGAPGISGAPPYGSPDHLARWQRVVDDTEPIERDIHAKIVDLLRRQEASILEQMHSARSTRVDPAEWFGTSRWTKTYRVEIRPLLARAVSAAAEIVWSDLGAPDVFNVGDPAVSRFLTSRAQRFATEVNATTWDELRRSLNAGITGGEGMPDLMARVREVMGDRIASSAETIARTETLGAYNGGALQAAKQSGLSGRKRWHSALDSRTRETHRAAHGQTVATGADFVVGGAEGPAPGSMGSAAEDINCRCSVQFLVDYDEP